MMAPKEHIQLLKEAASYLLTPDIERGTIPNRSKIIAYRLLRAALSLSWGQNDN